MDPVMYVRSLRPGDRVDIETKRQWYRGIVLEAGHHKGMYTVKCDSLSTRTDYEFTIEHVPGKRFSVRRLNVDFCTAVIGAMSEPTEHHDFEMLLREGPQPLGPGSHTDIGNMGIGKFGPALEGYRIVHYIEGVHDAELVVAAWERCNAPFKLRIALLRKQLQEADWTEAAELALELIEDLDVEEHGGTCPMCGEPYTGYLSHHLPCDGHKPDPAFQ